MRSGRASGSATSVRPTRLVPLARLFETLAGLFCHALGSVQVGGARGARLYATPTLGLRLGAHATGPAEHDDCSHDENDSHDRDDSSLCAGPAGREDRRGAGGRRHRMDCDVQEGAGPALAAY